MAWNAFKKELDKPNFSAALYTVLFLLSLLFGSAFVVSASALGIAALEHFENTPVLPSPTPTATPAPPPTPPPIYVNCSYKPNEQPCKDTVLYTIPRDTLVDMARRNYLIDGFVDPIYPKAICEANWVFLKEQFENNIPPNEQELLWEDDPCNYIVPETQLIIPKPPVTTP